MGGVRWRGQVNSDVSHPNLCLCQGGFGGMGTPTAVSRECWGSCLSLSLSHTPLPAMAALQPWALGHSRAGNTHGIILGLAWA